MPRADRRHYLWLGSVLLLGVFLAACGSGSMMPSSNQGSNMQQKPLSTPGGADLSVNSQAGQGAIQGKGRTVQGRVSDAAGKPLVGVLVTPQSTDTPPKEVPEIAVRTDEQGQYVWTIAPGHYTMTFVQEGYATNTQAVEVVSTQPTTLDVTLQRQ